MNTPSDSGAVGKIAGAISAGWGKLTSAVEKSVDRKNQQQEAAKKTRGDHFAAGHGMSPEHLGLLIKGATELDAQQHRQGLERFTAVDAASKPGKSIAMTAAGDVSVSEKRAKTPSTTPDAPVRAMDHADSAEKIAKASMPKKSPKMRGSRGARGGRAY